MKTVAKNRLAVFAAAAALALCMPVDASAQIVGSAVSAVAGSAQQVAAASTSMGGMPDSQPSAFIGTAHAAPPSSMPPQSPVAPAMAQPSMDQPSSIPVSTPAPALASADKTASSAPKLADAPKLPDSVKNVVKRLNSATEDVSLEDLNAAREAVAKLDLLIDIEKRMNDLAKLRSDREEKTGGSLANAIPASALGGRGPFAGAPNPMQQMNAGLPMASSPLPVSLPSSAAAPYSLSGGGIEVTKIVGAQGRYTATIKVGEEKPKQYREGDKLSDGSVIQSISSHGVSLVKDKKTRIVSVKDVTVVFNGR